MVNVASVGKMFTTIAVLQSLARRHLSIDSRISPFLPPDWVKGPGVGTITFSELLTHRAGFRLDSHRVFETDNAAREQIRHGIQQADKQVADYNNINFTIFRDMLPFMEGARDQGPAATRFFVSYVQRQVFDPVGVTDARCGPVRDAMLMYPPPAATRPRRPARVGPWGARGRLVYDTGQRAPGPVWPHPRPQPAIGQPTPADGRQLSGLGLLPHRLSQLRRQGRGDFADGSAALHTFFGIIAGTVPVVVVTNSDWGATNPNAGEDLTPVVETALFAATSYR